MELFSEIKEMLLLLVYWSKISIFFFMYCCLRLDRSSISNNFSFYYNFSYSFLFFVYLFSRFSGFSNFSKILL